MESNITPEIEIVPEVAPLVQPVKEPDRNSPFWVPAPKVDPTPKGSR